MTADIVAGGMTPIDRTSSGEIKPSHVFPKKYLELQDHEPLSKTDKIQISNEIESSQTSMPYRLSTDKNLNEYIHMLEQTANEDKKIAGALRSDDTASSNAALHTRQGGFNFLA